MLGRVATYVVPSLAVVITATVLLGPGATRKAAFARVYGTPRTGVTRLALRLEGAERLYGVNALKHFDQVSVEARDGDTALEAQTVALGADGIGEVLFTASKPLVGPVELRVTRGQTLLVEGAIPLKPDAPGKPQILSPFEIPGRSQGDYRITVTVPRGVLAAEHDNELRIQLGLAEHVSPSSPDAFAQQPIFISAPGTSSMAEKVVTDENGFAKLVLFPNVHHVELTLTVGNPSIPYHWQGTLPIIPGATWLHRDPHGFFFTSPVSRQRMYVSFARDTGRLFGAVLTTKENDAFVLWNREIPDDILQVATQVIVSSDPQEQGPGTVAWPLEPEKLTVVAPPLELLLDGARVAEERERGRASRVRRVALLVVIATTIFEVLFMIARLRQSQKRFENSLMGFVEREPSEERESTSGILATARQESPGLRLALTISLICVAFSMIAALSTLQW